MNKKFAVPRGTSDILPDAVPFWEEVESKARKICKSYGYREIRTPVYEDVNLFKRSLGATSDVVNKQLLELASGKEDEGYALRPEGTASVVRSYNENNLDKNEPLSKLFYIGPMFRGERPQKGRFRQFHQIGVESIGPNSACAYLDAEMIILAMHLLKEIGVKGPKLKINSLGSAEDKLKISAWLRAEFADHKSDLCIDCRERFERNVFRVLDCKKEQCKKFVQDVVFKGGAVSLPLSQDSAEYFSKVLRCLESTGVDFAVSHDLVRGLDYYTHTVFEITSEGLGSQDAVGAGGRYDGLVYELGGSENVNGIGFALGVERILLSVGYHTPRPEPDSFVIAMDEQYQQNAFLLVQQLRKEGIGSDMAFGRHSFKSQLNRANKMNVHYVLILGDNEIRDNTVALKDMQLGTQVTVESDKIAGVLKDKLQRVGMTIKSI